MISLEVPNYILQENKQQCNALIIYIVSRGKTHEKYDLIKRSSILLSSEMFDRHFNIYIYMTHDK